MRGSLRRWLPEAGFASPISYLALVVAAGMIVLAAGAVVIDRERSLRQSAAVTEAVADLARQRTIGLLTRIDMTLRAVAAVENDSPAAIDATMAPHRQAEPRLIALYLLGPDNAVLAGSAGGTIRTGSLVASCMAGERPDADQVFMHAVTLEQAGGGVLRGLCVARGVRHNDKPGAALGVIAADLIAAQYADLKVGDHGAVVLLDENARALATAAPGAPVTLNPETPPAPLTSWEGLRGGKGTVLVSSGSVEARLIERPFGAIVAVALPAEDALAEWRSRAQFIWSSAATVALFITLAAIAVLRCERRERTRLERLAALTLDLQNGSEPGALSLHVAEAARAMVGGQIEPGGTSAAPDSIRTPDLTLPGARFVRIGAHVLSAPCRRGFTGPQLTTLTVLARIGAVHVHTADRLGKLDGALAALQARADLDRADADAVLLEMPDATFTLDQHWRITTTNRNADRLFGEYGEDVRGCSIWDVFPELEGSQFEIECHRVVNGRVASEFEMKWLRTETWLMVHIHPRATGIAVYLQDISRRVATDDRLRDAAKMEAIGRLTGGIAHDFNNLLTVILGNIEMLDFELPENGEVRDMHEQIRKAAMSAAERTHQMLAFARRQPLAPREVDVGHLVAGLDGTLGHAMGTESTIEINHPASLWKIRVDATQLESALISLASNARDAIPAGRGGRLVVDCANIAIRKTESDRFGELRPGNYVVISLSDNGVGIPRDVLGKVFEPFFTTKPGGQGIGLGLAMVYGFVTQSGGHVRVVSAEGRGATVRLYFPALPEPKPEALEPAPPKRQDETLARASGERILVIEDSDMVRSYARNVLTGLGYDVTSVPDGAAALARIDAGEQPDLLLTDVLLADGIDGITVANQILRRLPGLPVIYMSGYVENIDIAKLNLAPGHNLLLKPFRRAALARMVRARLAGNISV